MYVEQEQTNLKRIVKKCAYFWFFVLVCCYLPLLRTLLSLPASICTISMLEKRGIFTENANSESLTLVLCSSLIQDRMMDPRHPQLPRSKDHLQLRQQVKPYPPFFWLLPFLISTHKYLYNFHIYQKSVDFLLKMLIVNY